jgi:2-polyprenyl-6-methoxyphenol hydroxylase-like FAD-dependent oxidoreductase
VKDRLGVIVCVPRPAQTLGLAAIADRVRRAVPRAGGRLDRILAEIGDDAYFWELNDKRSATWHSGRVGLVGDAAAGFLPTAGIGAAMAIESAAVLARHLVGCSPETVEAALGAYEREQRTRVEAAQDNSRQLAPIMFNENRFAAVLRDTAVRIVPLRMALGPIRGLLGDRPVAV